VPSFELGASHAGAYPFADQVAFEFCDRSDDDDDGAAQRAAGVDLFAEADVLNTLLIELIKKLKEVPG
jgi:hypothetical protein